jgi:hypothetical protein
MNLQETADQAALGLKRLLQALTLASMFDIIFFPKKREATGWHNRVVRAIAGERVLK